MIAPMPADPEHLLWAAIVLIVSTLAGLYGLMNNDKRGKL